MPLFLSKGSSSSSYNSLMYSWSEVVQGLCKACKHSENSQRDQKTLRTRRIVLPSPSWWLVSFMISDWSWSKCCYNVICTIQVTKKVTRVFCLRLQPFCWNLDFHFVQLISHAILAQFWVADNQGYPKDTTTKGHPQENQATKRKKFQQQQQQHYVPSPILSPTCWWWWWWSSPPVLCRIWLETIGTPVNLSLVAFAVAMLILKKPFQ